MIQITRTLKINKFTPKQYPIYKADEYTGNVQHWKDCKAGEWGESDDGYVSECISRKTYKTGTELTFPFGKQWITNTSTLSFLEHYNTKSYSSSSTKSYMEQELKKSRAKNVLDAYMVYIMAGKSPDFEQLGRMYRPDQQSPVMTVKRLFKSKGMKAMIEEKMKDILNDHGIDEGFVLETIKEAIGVAKVKEDSGNMIRAAKELGDMLDMKPKTRTQTDTVELDLTRQIGKSFETEKKKLKATKTQPLMESNGKATEDINE
tara:strand:+ start:906 stop:1688 length:783 start_codon:yes stop_codon:yes gene_type:complete